ncbi:MAG: hypothetical protein JWO48_679 [Bryobacterales bacterium]|nr:hypothetical protein [Bryobacterales bacterium]
MTTKTIASLCALLLATQDIGAWGVRGHTLANLAAVETIPSNGPAFLKAQKAYIGHLGTIPDTWRSVAEPYLRISEDANHSWYTEGFDFMPEPPRSRTEFILRVHDEYLRISKSDPERAKLLNIRYTGLQAYSIIEGYERMKAGMRLYRHVSDRNSQPFSNISSLYRQISPAFQDAAQVKQMLATDIAFYMGWLGHYVADAAMPLHDSIHHDGWVGDNPKEYTRDPNIHGRFESEYVDLIATTEADLLKHVPREARHLDNPWQATLNHSLDARNFVEDVYRLDLSGAFRDKDNREARELVYKRIAAGATFLRDLAYTAWIESAKPVPQVKPIDQPHNPQNPRFNPAAGSAPAPSQ